MGGVRFRVNHSVAFVFQKARLAVQGATIDYHNLDDKGAVLQDEDIAPLRETIDIFKSERVIPENCEFFLGEVDKQLILVFLQKEYPYSNSRYLRKICRDYLDGCFTVQCERLLQIASHTGERDRKQLDPIETYLKENCFLPFDKSPIFREPSGSAYPCSPVLPSAGSPLARDNPARLADCRVG